MIDAITSKRNDPIPEWKLSQYSGDPLQWHEWYGLFKSAIDSQSLTDYVNLTYLKTVLTGKAKTAITEFAYCGAMYTDALMTLKRKFGQPQEAVSAHLDKLNSFPPLKMHNSDNVINYSGYISSLAGVFKSLSYDLDLKSAALLNTAVQKLPPDMKGVMVTLHGQKALGETCSSQFQRLVKGEGRSARFNEEYRI